MGYRKFHESTCNSVLPCTGSERADPRHFGWWLPLWSARIRENCGSSGRIQFDAQLWVEPSLPFVRVPGRVGDESRLPKPFIHRVVHVSVDPEGGLVALDQPVQVGGESRVQRIVLEPSPDRARARRVVGDYHRSFAGKLRPCELSLDEMPIFPMPSDGLPRAEVPPVVSNRAREVRYAPAHPPVRPTSSALP